MLRPSAVLGGGVKSAVEAAHSFVVDFRSRWRKSTSTGLRSIPVCFTRWCACGKACRTWSGGNAIVMNDTEAPRKPFAGEGGYAPLS